MKRISIIHNDQKPEAVRFSGELESQLREREFVISELSDDTECLIVIGGDGTLINAAKRIRDCELPVLAVNMGSLGFLTDIREEEALAMVDRVAAGEYTTERRYFLRCLHNERECFALNDLVLTRGHDIGRMINVEMHANGEYVNIYRADGIIVATPTGSTAYSLSAGGPIVRPGLKVLVVTPIAPHTMTARPLVIDGSDELSLNLTDEHKEAMLMIDGQEFTPVRYGDDLRVSLCDRFITLVKPPNRDYYSVLREKLQWGRKLF